MTTFLILLLLSPTLKSALICTQSPCSYLRRLPFRKDIHSPQSPYRRLHRWKRNVEKVLPASTPSYLDYTMDQTRGKLIARYTSKPRRPSGEDLVPYIQALTVLALSFLFILWRKAWTQRVIDLSICIICISLHHLTLPLLSLGIAVGHTFFTTSPGNFTSLELPTYAEFTRQLKHESSEEQECGICYDSSQTLAQLPCSHYCCIRCLDLMAKDIQTICPYCRRPLFDVYDRWVYVLTKGCFSFYGADAFLCAVIGVHYCKQAAWGGALLFLGASCYFGVCFYMFLDLMKQFGDTWWRGGLASGMKPFDVKMQAFGCSVGISVFAVLVSSCNRLFA